MLPLGDNITTARPPVVVTVLMALCVAVFVAQLFAADDGRALIRAFGFIPARWSGQAALPLNPLQMPVGGTLLTYVLFHSGWLHLLGNLLYLWIFADNVEDATGHPQFLLFFLATSAVAAAAHAWPMPDSQAPVIGASGGISGVLGAYLVLHPRAEISIAVPVPFTIQIVRLPAWVVLAAWFVFNFVLDLYFGAAAGIAFRAHIGGFLAGMVLIWLFAPRLRERLRSLVG